MNTRICLLRGINVGGHNKVKMADLRHTLSNLGLKNVQTYIQSGNILFESKKRESDLAHLIRSEVHKQFGFDVPTLVRSSSFLKKIVKQNPFQKLDQTKLHVTILEKAAKKADVELIDSALYSPDQFHVFQDIVYLYYPNGCARTKLTNTLFEKRLKTTSTSRNWRTINKLIELAS